MGVHLICGRGGIGRRARLRIWWFSRAGSSPVARTIGQLPPPIIEGQQQKSEPYHTMVGFGFTFILCTKIRNPNFLGSDFSLFLLSFYDLATVFVDIERGNHASH